MLPNLSAGGIMWDIFKVYFPAIIFAVFFILIFENFRKRRRERENKSDSDKVK